MRFYLFDRNIFPILHAAHIENVLARSKWLTQKPIHKLLFDIYIVLYSANKSLKSVNFNFLLCCQLQQVHQQTVSRWLNDRSALY